MWFHLVDTGHDHMGWGHMDPGALLKFNKKNCIKSEIVQALNLLSYRSIISSIKESIRKLKKIACLLNN